MQHVADLSFSKLSTIGTSWCWECWVTCPRYGNRCSMETCSTNWSERAGKSDRELLPSTQLLLLLKILVKNQNFISFILNPTKIFAKYMVTTISRAAHYVLIDVFCPSDGFLHLSRLWLPTLWGGQYFVISFYLEQQVPESCSASTKLQTQYQSFSCWSSCNCKAEPTCRASLVTQNKQPRPVLSALTSLTTLSTAHSNSVARNSLSLRDSLLLLLHRTEQWALRNVHLLLHIYLVYCQSYPRRNSYYTHFYGSAQCFKLHLRMWKCPVTSVQVWGSSSCVHFAIYMNIQNIHENIQNIHDNAISRISVL